MTLHRTDGGSSIDSSYSFLTVAIRGSDRGRVGRRFSGVAVEMALASYPGFNLTAPPGDAQPCSVYWPALVGTGHVTQRVIFEGHVLDVAPTPGVERETSTPTTIAASPLCPGPTEPVPLGRLLGARSGDKGGNANLGVWAETDEAHAWMDAFLTVDRLRALLPEAHDLTIERHALPNLRALNFVLQGFLGDGVASSLAVDPQAKGLGEVLRARVVPVPLGLLPRGDK